MLRNEADYLELVKLLAVKKKALSEISLMLALFILAEKEHSCNRCRLYIQFEEAFICINMVKGFDIIMFYYFFIISSILVFF